MKIHQVITRHLPSITLKSYGSTVNCCRCGKFTPEGDDEKSWKEWAKHIEQEYWKGFVRAFKKKFTPSAIRPHAVQGIAPLTQASPGSIQPQHQRKSKGRKSPSN